MIVSFRNARPPRLSHLLLALILTCAAHAGDPHCPRTCEPRTTPSIPAKRSPAPAAPLFPTRYAGVARSVPEQPANFIDAILFELQDQAGISRTYLCDDLAFMRRVTLDLTGRIPTLERILAFQADTASDKRAAYIDELLASEAFVVRWSHWFNELFETTYKVQNTRGAAGFTLGYLYEALRENRPLDQMATELITARGNSYRDYETNYLLRAGGLGGILQDRADNEATHSADSFLGTSLACISCHDGQGYLDDINLFLAQQKREDFWRMASFLTFKSITSQNSLAYGFNLNDREDTPYYAGTTDGMRPPRSGGVIQPAYIFDGAPPEPGENPAHALARMVVADRMFARNFANRLWGHLMAQPFVSPYNELDPYRLDPDNPPLEPWTLQPNRPRLFEALADHLIANGFDLRQTLRTIANSHSYQLSSDYADAWRPEYAAYYPRRQIRELTGEEVYDQLIVSSGMYSLAGTAYLRLDLSVPYDAAFPFHFAHELPDPNGEYTYFRTAAFLETFGAGNRYDQPRSSDPSPGQALLMMNHPLVVERIGPAAHLEIWRPGDGSSPGYYEEIPGSLAILANSDLDMAEKIRRTFLAILVREPTRAEHFRVRQLIGKRHFAKACADLHWILYNYTELRINY